MYLGLLNIYHLLFIISYLLSIVTNYLLTFNSFFFFFMIVKTYRKTCKLTPRV